MDTLIYTCIKCDFHTHIKCIFNNHRKIHKFENSIYKCKLCGFSTSRIGNLNKHLDGKRHIDKLANTDNTTDVYSNRKFYDCDMCDSKYILQSSLIRHYKIHEKPKKEIWHSCSICEFKTLYKGNLRPHLKTHIPKEKRKYYYCRRPGCLFKSVDARNLGRHVKCHINSKKYRDFSIMFNNKVIDMLKNKHK